MKLTTDGVLWRTVDDQIVVLDLRRSRYLSVNGTGAELWRRLADGCTVDTLVDVLVDEYERPHAAAAVDVDAFLDGLRHHDLLLDE